MGKLIYNRDYIMNDLIFEAKLVDTLRKGKAYVVKENYFVDVVTKLVKMGFILTVSYDNVDDVYMVCVKDKQ